MILLRLAGKSNEHTTYPFYIYDTVDNLADRQVVNHRQHRNLYASIAKWSRFFRVAPGKVTAPQETAGEAVLVGEASDCESFCLHFDWPDAVIEIQADGSNAAGVLSKLLTEPECLRQISSRNAEEALRASRLGVSLEEDF